MAAGFGETVAELCEAWAPWRPRELDIGGGFPAPRDPTHPDRREAQPIDRYADAIATSTSRIAGTGWCRSGGRSCCRSSPGGVSLQMRGCI